MQWGEIAFKIALAYRIFYRKCKIASPTSQLLSWLFERQGEKITVKAVLDRGTVQCPIEPYSATQIRGQTHKKSPPTVGYFFKVHLSGKVALEIHTAYMGVSDVYTYLVTYLNVSG